VVTSGVGGQSWVVKDGFSGVVLSGPDDVSGAAQAVKTLVDKPKRWNKLSRRSKETASQFTMGRLMQSFIQLVSKELTKKGSVDKVYLEPGEKLIEAWARKGYKVVVTTSTLNIESDKKGQRVVIPLEEIVRLDKRREFSWRTPVLGALASLAVYLALVLYPPAMVAFDSLLNPLSSVSPWISAVLLWLTVFLPLGLSLIVTVATPVKGYSILFGESNRAFLPAEFAKALRIADELTPHSLFPADMPP
jgi:hypothetical protein